MTGQMHTTQAHAVSAREKAAAELTREPLAAGTGTRSANSSDTSQSHDVEGSEYRLMFPTLPPVESSEQAVLLY